MRFEILFVSLIALLLGSILLAAGGFLIFYPHQLFTIDPFIIGIFFVIIALSLFAAFYGLSRKRYLRCKMGGYSISESVLSDLAKKSLHELFPKEEITCDVVVRRGKSVEITAHLPYVEEREDLLNQVESCLTQSLTKSCGFKEAFHFNVYFCQPKRS